MFFAFGGSKSSPTPPYDPPARKRTSGYGECQANIRWPSYDPPLCFQYQLGGMIEQTSSILHLQPGNTPITATPLMNRSSPHNDPIRVISPSLVLVDWGPMTLLVSAWLEGEPRPVMAALGAREALGCLAELADFHKYLKQKVEGLNIKPSLPRAVARCVEACQAVSGELTGLAGVAGAAADQVLAAVMDQGADQAIVNNGGDIALRAVDGNPLRVGLRPLGALSGQTPDLDAVLKVSRGSGIGGVASSGWQGRSHSPGVADLVTPWAAERRPGRRGGYLDRRALPGGGSGHRAHSGSGAGPGLRPGGYAGHQGGAAAEPRGQTNRSGQRPGNGSKTGAGRGHPGLPY